MGSNDMQIFVRNLQGRDVTFIVQPSMNLATLRRVVFQDARVPLPEGTILDDLRLIFKGKQLHDPWATLADHNIEANNTVHLVLRLHGGMAKKGLKKVTKQEKRHQLQARVQYMSQNIAANVQAAINQITTNPNFLQTCVHNMPLQQLQQFSIEINGYTRNDQLLTHLPKALIPEVAQLEQQKAQIESAISAIESAVEYAFAEQYYVDYKYQSDPFYEMVDNRLTALQRQADQDARNAEIQHQAGVLAQQLAAQQLAAQAAASSSGAMQEG